MSYSAEWEIRRYLAPDGRDPFGEWLRSLRDPAAKAAVAIRIARMATGNQGDSRPVGGRVRELRIDIGPGYRVYFVTIAGGVVLLLGGGDKRRQDVDIARARRRFEDHQRRSEAS